jgi:DNA invertase Pin-like site-specific DNA recombinase
MDLVAELGVNPSTFLVLFLAAYEGNTPREILLKTVQELEKLGLADAVLPSEPSSLPHPRKVDSKKKWEKVQALKSVGRSQAEVVALLGIPRTTVSRLWNKSAD